MAQTKGKQSGSDHKSHNTQVSKHAGEQQVINIEACSKK